MATPTETPKKGPRNTCPACGSSNVSNPVYCAPSVRSFVGLLRVLDGVSPWCDKSGKHLHQKCLVCTCSWTGTPVDITDK